MVVWGGGVYIINEIVILFVIIFFVLIGILVYFIFILDIVILLNEDWFCFGIL